jgi:hypothetical protein
MTLPSPQHLSFQHFVERLALQWMGLNLSERLTPTS